MDLFPPHHITHRPTLPPPPDPPRADDGGPLWTTAPAGMRYAVHPIRHGSTSVDGGEMNSRPGMGGEGRGKGSAKGSKEGNKRRRGRMATACKECNRRKQKCDGLSPCTNCSRRNMQERCHYPPPAESSTTDPSGEGASATGPKRRRSEADDKGKLRDEGYQHQPEGVMRFDYSEAAWDEQGEGDEDGESVGSGMDVGGRTGDQLHPPSDSSPYRQRHDRYPLPISSERNTPHTTFPSSSSSLHYSAPPPPPPPVTHVTHHPQLGHSNATPRNSPALPLLNYTHAASHSRSHSHTEDHSPSTRSGSTAAGVSPDPESALGNRFWRSYSDIRPSVSASGLSGAADGADGADCDDSTRGAGAAAVMGGASPSRGPVAPGLGAVHHTHTLLRPDLTVGAGAGVGAEAAVCGSGKSKGSVSSESEMLMEENDAHGVGSMRSHPGPWEGAQADKTFFGTSHFGPQLAATFFRNTPAVPLSDVRHCPPRGSSPLDSMKPYTLESVTRELVSCLPPRDECDRYVQLYFDRYNVHNDIVYQQEFIASYDRFWSLPSPFPTVDLRHLALLFLILAFGILLEHDASAPDRRLAEISALGLPPDGAERLRRMVRELETRGIGLKEREEKSMLWSHAAKRALSEAGRFFGESMDTVRAGVLSAMYLNACRRVPEAWTAIGQAIRAAQALGLHVDGSSWKGLSALSSKEAELRRRLWAQLYIVDRSISLFLGRPVCIQDSQFTTCEPSNISDDLLDAPPSHPPPLSEPTKSTFLVLHLRLARIIGQVQLTCFDLSHRRYADVLACERMFRHFRDDLPRHFRLDEEADRQLDGEVGFGWLKAQRMTLISKFHLARISLHRPYLMRSFGRMKRAPTGVGGSAATSAAGTPGENPYVESREALLQSATADLQLRIHLDAQDPLDRFKVMTVASGFNSATIIAIVLHFGYSTGRYKASELRSLFKAYVALEEKTVRRDEVLERELDVLHLALESDRGGKPGRGKGKGRAGGTGRGSEGREGGEGGGGGGGSHPGAVEAGAGRENRQSETRDASEIKPAGRDPHAPVTVMSGPSSAGSHLSGEVPPPRYSSGSGLSHEYSVEGGGSRGLRYHLGGEAFEPARRVPPFSMPQPQQPLQLAPDPDSGHIAHAAHAGQKNPTSHLVNLLGPSMPSNSTPLDLHMLINPAGPSSTLGVNVDWPLPHHPQLSPIHTSHLGQPSYPSAGPSTSASGTHTHHTLTSATLQGSSDPAGAGAGGTTDLDMAATWTMPFAYDPTASGLPDSNDVPSWSSIFEGRWNDADLDPDVAMAVFGDGMWRTDNSWPDGTGA